MGWADAIGSARFDKRGTATGSYLARKSEDRAWHRSKDNRQWSLNQDNTKHQREIKDLKAAGLNPILSAKYGSGGPPAPGSPGTQSFGVERTSSNPMLDAVTAKAAKKQLELTEKQIDNVEAQTDKVDSETAINTARQTKEDLEASIWDTIAGEALAWIEKLAPSAKGAKEMHNYVEKRKEAKEKKKQKRPVVPHRNAGKYVREKQAAKGNFNRKTGEM